MKATDYSERITLYLQNKAIALQPLLWNEQLFIEQVKQLDFNFQSQRIFNHSFKQRLQQQILLKIQAYHIQHNDQLGVTKARLYRIATADQPQDLIYHFIDELIETKQLAQTRGWIHTPDHKIALDKDELQMWQQIKPLFDTTNQALWVRDIANALACDESIIRHLLYKAGKLGYVIPIVKDRFLLNEQIEQFATQIRAYIQQNGAISVNQLRDEIQYGRKLTVQLIEYFDRIGFLRRRGNTHLLRDQDIFKTDNSSSL